VANHRAYYARPSAAGPANRLQAGRHVLASHGRAGDNDRS
jgi:hypothetical protein